MAKVIEALEGREHALLESPTGTGKTLCLLCSVLAWRATLSERLHKSWEQQGDNWATNTKTAKEMRTQVPRIFYTSRTHSQLKQITKELRKTNYRPSSTVIASREQLCLHKTVQKLKGAKQNAMCNQLCRNSRGPGEGGPGGVQARPSSMFGGNVGASSGGGGGDESSKKCPFYTGLRFGKRHLQLGDTSLLDIQELSTACERAMVCPFWKTREDSQTAELILCPYNYLIDPQTRKALGVDLTNSVLNRFHNECCGRNSRRLPMILLSYLISYKGGIRATVSV
jgi:Rad3-related DNA helicase